MSSTTPPSPPRAGSYILVSSSTLLDDSTAAPDELEPYARARPRLFFLLPLVAALDIALAVTLGILVLRQEAKHHDRDAPTPTEPPFADPIMFHSFADSPPTADLDDAAWERRKIVLAVVAFSIARASAYAIIGISKRVRQLGVTVAAISILSTLFYVSIANLLFQARPKPDALDAMVFSWTGLTLTPSQWRWPDTFRHFEPTMPILVGAQLALTLFEWILYIAVVGVKIPPGANPVEAKRWARGLADDPDYQRGVDAHSLYPSDGEEEGEVLAEQNVDAQQEADVEQARALLASPISNLSHRNDAGSSDASDQPLLGTGPSTPRGYGSTLQTAPKTPRTPSHGHTHSQGSVRSTRSPAQGMSRSTSARSGMYSRSPGAAELAVGQVIEDDDDGDDHDDDEGEEEDAEGSDPDDIIDITPNRAVARKEARLRLARAALPERRASGGTLSTLNIFGSDASAPSTAAAGGAQAKTSGGRLPNVFSDEAGSPLGRNTQDQMPPALLSVATSPEMSRGGARPVETSRHSSMSLLPSSSSMRTTSTKGSGKDRKFRLPKWMKPNKKK